MEVSAMSKQVSGPDFVQGLKEAGFDLPNKLKRMIIDIRYNRKVTIYYETLASKANLDAVMDVLIKNKDNIEQKDIE